MREDEVLRALERDESYTVARVLASGPAGTTELVLPAGAPSGAKPLVRKRLPAGLENRAAWEAARKARHRLLPRVADIYELPDELVVVYEYVEGTSLSEAVASSGPLPAEQAAKVAVDVCAAAQALHACGVVHRDISPGNVVLAYDGAHLTDLGIARLCQPKGSGRDTTLLGTQGFAAPEQFGFAETDARADVYSIGRLLAYMLGGPGPDGSGPSPDALQGMPGIPAALADTVRKACSFDRGDRYQSADELARAIASACRGARPPRRPLLVKPGPLRRAMREAGRLRKALARLSAWLVGLGAAAVVTAACLSNVGSYIEQGQLAPNLLLVFGMVAGWVAAFSLEAPAALTGAGPYKERHHPALLLLWRLVLVSSAIIVWILLLVAWFGGSGGASA